MLQLRAAVGLLERIEDEVQAVVSDLQGFVRSLEGKAASKGDSASPVMGTFEKD